MSDALAHITALYRSTQAGQPPAPGALDAYVQGGRLVPPAGLSLKQKATFCWYAGDVAREQGLSALAIGAYEQLIALEEALGEAPAGLANSYARLGASLAAAGRADEAGQAFAAGEARLGRPPVPAPYFHFMAAFVLSEAEEYGLAGPHWQRAYAQYRAAGDIDKAAKARLSMTFDLLQMARNTYARGDAAMQAGAAEAALAELADQFYAMTVTAKRLVDEMMADPELAPRAAQGRVYFRVELANAFTVIGNTAEAIAQLQDAAAHPDTSEGDRAMIREQLAQLSAG